VSFVPRGKIPNNTWTHFIQFIDYVSAPAARAAETGGGTVAAAVAGGWGRSA